jgi:hypothetical protein
MIPDEIKAEKGDKILPKFKKLVAWIDSQRLISVDDRVTTNTTPNGTYVSMVEGPPSIVTPLRVVQSGIFFGVTEGYINGKIPIRENNPIIDEQGTPIIKYIMPKQRPFFVFCYVFFDKNFKYLNSYIGARKDVDLEARYDADLEQIASEIPLAFMRSDRFIQFVTHNLQVRAYKHNGSYRVVYWPA